MSEGFRRLRRVNVRALPLTEAAAAAVAAVPARPPALRVPESQDEKARAGLAHIERAVRAACPAIPQEKASYLATWALSHSIGQAISRLFDLKLEVFARTLGKEEIGPDMIPRLFAVTARLDLELPSVAIPSGMHQRIATKACKSGVDEEAVS